MKNNLWNAKELNKTKTLKYARTQEFCGGALMLQHCFIFKVTERKKEAGYLNDRSSIE